MVASFLVRPEVMLSTPEESKKRVVEPEAKPHLGLGFFKLRGQNYDQTGNIQQSGETPTHPR